MKTTDLCDAHENTVQVADPVWHDYGGIIEFGGAARTLKVFEDNSLVRRELELPGSGRVLVVDGGGSLRCALLGGKLAELAQTNGWAGVIVYGCVRDRLELAACDVGVKALSTHPRKSQKRDEGQAGLVLSFAGCRIREGDYVYGDEDGLIISNTALLLPVAG